MCAANFGMVAENSRGQRRIKLKLKTEPPPTLDMNKWT